MANTSAIYSSMLHIPPTSYHILAAKQEPYQKAYLLTKNIEEFSEKKARRMGQYAGKKREEKKKKTERAMGVGRITVQKIVK